MDVRIYLTGRVAVEHRGEIVIDERQFRGRQTRLAFAYLVMERARPVPRWELATLIWPSEMPPAWETALNTLVSRLRGLLARSPLDASISGGFGQYQLKLPGDAWADVEAATVSIDAAEGALRNGDPRRAFGPATVTATITRRPFLASDKGPRAQGQRKRLRRQLQRALECLATVWVSTGEPALAIEAATEAVALDSYRESGYQMLMRAHEATGNRAEAIRVYHNLRELLSEELGTDPSRETEALYQEMLR